MGVLGIYAVYLVTARFVSRRAGVLAAIVVRDGADVQPGRAPGDDRHGLRRADGDGAGAGRRWRCSTTPTTQLPRRGAGLAELAAPSGSSTARWRCSRVTVLPQLVDRFDPAEGGDPLGRARVVIYGAVAMIPYYLGLRAVRVPGGAHPLQGAALPLPGGDPVRAGGAGQGAGGAGAAADRLRSPTWRSPGAGGGSGAPQLLLRLFVSRWSPSRWSRCPGTTRC